MLSPCRISFLLLLAASASAAPRQHIIVLGKWQTVKTLADSGEASEVKVRSLIVDGRGKEYTSGPAHAVTDRLFVIRRAYRVNDVLPDDHQKTPQWISRLCRWITLYPSPRHIAHLNP